MHHAPGRAGAGHSSGTPDRSAFAQLRRCTTRGRRRGVRSGRPGLFGLATGPSFHASRRTATTRPVTLYSVAHTAPADACQDEAAAAGGDASTPVGPTRPRRRPRRPPTDIRSDRHRRDLHSPLRRRELHAPQPHAFRANTAHRAPGPCRVQVVRLPWPAARPGPQHCPGHRARTSRAAADLAGGLPSGYHPDDVDLCLEIDRFPFAMMARQEESLTVLRPVADIASSIR